MTPAQLQKILTIPAARAEAWAAPLSQAMGRYKIDERKRQAAFLAQVGVESGALKYTREIWGPTAWQKRYEGHKGLGNTQPGDGRRYCGRGLIQVTGRYNYAACSLALYGNAQVLIEHPEYLETPEAAALSAAWFWDAAKLNALADIGDIERITRRVNGPGMLHKEQRRALYAKALAVLA